MSPKRGFKNIINAPMESLSRNKDSDQNIVERLRWNDGNASVSDGGTQDRYAHVLRHQLRHMRTPINPRIHHVRPLLEHVPSRPAYSALL